MGSLFSSPHSQSRKKKTEQNLRADIPRTTQHTQRCAVLHTTILSMMQPDLLVDGMMKDPKADGGGEGFGARLPSLTRNVYFPH